MEPSSEVTRTVAGYRVPHAVDDGEGGRRLGRVSLIAQRHIAFLGEPADAFVAGGKDRAAVLGRHVGVGSGVERAGRDRARHRHVMHLRAGLRGAHPVDHDARSEAR